MRNRMTGTEPSASLAHEVLAKGVQNLATLGVNLWQSCTAISIYEDSSSAQSGKRVSLWIDGSSFSLGFAPVHYPDSWILLAFSRAPPNERGARTASKSATWPFFFFSSSHPQPFSRLISFALGGVRHAGCGVASWSSAKRGDPSRGRPDSDLESDGESEGPIN